MNLTFFKREQGVAAIEFALIAPVFFVLLLGTIELSFKTLIQSQLDHVMYNTVVKLATEEDMAVSRDDYKNQVVCNPGLLSFLDCDKLQFGVEALSTQTRIRGRFNESFVGRWNTGCGGSNLIVELIYPSPDVLLPFGIVDMVSMEDENYIRSRGLTRREPIVVGSGRLEGGVSCF